MSYKEYLDYLLDTFEEIINDIKEINNFNNDTLKEKIPDYDKGYYDACMECITNNICDLEVELSYDLNPNNAKIGENKNE